MPYATIRPEHILRAREVVARLSVEEKVAQLEAVPFSLSPNLSFFSEA